MNIYHPRSGMGKVEIRGLRGRPLSLLGECLACFVLAVLNIPKPITNGNLRSSSITGGDGLRHSQMAIDISLRDELVT